MVVSSVNLGWIIDDCVEKLMLIKKTNERVKDCSRLVETLEVDKEYRFQGDPLRDGSRWENLTDPNMTDVRIRTRKIKKENGTWEKWNGKWEASNMKLIEGIKNSSSTREECQNLVFDFYETKNEKIIVSFEENAKKECSHSNDFSVKLENDNNAFLWILEPNPDKNGGETTTSSNITEQVNPEKTDESENVNVILYASIGLGVLAIILVALIFLFIVKLRKQSNVEVIETNDIYGEHLDYEEEKAAKVTDTNDYYTGAL